MGPDLGAFFQNRDADLGPGLGGQLLQTDGGRQPRGTGAHDDDVVFHGFTFDVFAHDPL